MSKYKKTKKCLDCDKLIGANAERCLSCASKLRQTIKPSNFKDGHTLNRKCVDCGAHVTKQATKCRECSRRDLLERMKLLAESRKGIPLFTSSEKQCRTCKQILPVSEFYKKRLHYQSDCKKCVTINYREYIKNNREYINKYNIEFNHKTGRNKYYGQGNQGGRKKPIRLSPDGKLYNPYWDTIKKEIYKRDFWTCQECGEHCHQKGQIQCHHIDYNTGNNEDKNLITLCRRCHAMTNIHKREFFIWYYQNKISQMIEG